MKNFFLKKIAVIAIVFFANYSFGQVINGYAKVSHISGTTLTLSTVDESGDSFEDGEWIIIMQMQGDCIGTTSNTAGFGDLGAIGSTGLYEARQILSHTESGGVPNSITVTAPFTNTYSTCVNCSVQIISFPSFGSPDYTTTGNMSAMDWDGDIGGVLAFFVPGTLTLAHNLDANEAGFRGAGVNGGSSTGCTGSSSYRIPSTDNHADKGEGIYKSVNVSYAAGRANILTGGGGGNSHNAGGGGGGNYTAGGLGGPGWPTCTPTAGGIGGLDMSATITANRIFMGGGAGAGEGNNGNATPGEDGGGIILVRAQEIVTTTCAGLTISANGGSVTGTSGNDGSGGGGAGGSIVFEVATWTIAGTCPVTISANGGDGGAVNSGATHGGGGGGGQGAIFFSDAEPTTNITTETNNGNGGCNNNSSPCSSAASNGSGVDGSGVFDILTGPLPIELVSFTAEHVDDHVELAWQTKSERDNDFFTVERSVDGENWERILIVDGAGNSSTTLNYATWDFVPELGLSYYRLKQTDFNGTYSYSDISSVFISNASTLVYPNPAKDEIYVYSEEINAATVYLTDATGRQIDASIVQKDKNTIRIDARELKTGVYFVQIDKQGKQATHRVVVSH